MEEIKIGQNIKIRFKFSETQIYTYRGELLDITDSYYVINDIKVGEIRLKKSEVIIISRFYPE